MRVWVWFFVVCGCLYAQTPQQKSLSFALTPEMYASLMAQSLQSSLPQTFKHETLELVVQKVYSDKNRVHFEATTKQYEALLKELKKHTVLPTKVKKECKEFSSLVMVNQGVEYIVHINVKGKKPLEILYDKEACLEHFNPQDKLFIGGYNKKGIALAKLQKPLSLH